LKTGNILDRIVASKRIEVERLRSSESTGAGAMTLGDRVRARGGSRDFMGALVRPRNGSMALIAEVKKASPSAGVIRADFDPVRIAREYEAAGADCLSVLTDAPYFQGSLEYLRDIRQAVDLPLLRKDFIIDALQIAEAIEWGADAILLIVAILTDEQLAGFYTLAADAGLAVLVEVHDEAELDRALAIDAKLIGVNNRNLKDFTVDLGTTERLSARIPEGRGGRVLVAESGIHTAADVTRVGAAGAGAILVGESLMRHGDLREKVAELLQL
jgi:indole-3-glycerol phosphate synthase